VANFVHGLFDRQCGQIGMRERVVAQLDLPGIHQWSEKVLIVHPRVVTTVHEIGETKTGVLRELGVHTHHVAVDAVVKRQCQRVTVAGQTPQSSPARQGDSGLRGRRRQQAGQSESRRRRGRLGRREHGWRRVYLAAGQADARNDGDGKASQEFAPIQV
jgi:hypothetical protein